MHCGVCKGEGMLVLWNYLNLMTFQESELISTQDTDLFMGQKDKIHKGRDARYPELSVY